MTGGCPLPNPIITIRTSHNLREVQHQAPQLQRVRQVFEVGWIEEQHVPRAEADPAVASSTLRCTSSKTEHRFWRPASLANHLAFAQGKHFGQRNCRAGCQHEWVWPRDSVDLI